MRHGNTRNGGPARRFLSRFGFVREAVAAVYCLRDPATPWRVKALAAAALVYLVAPVDLVPDVILLLGLADDAALAWAAWRGVAGRIGEDHRAKARAFLGRGE